MLASVITSTIIVCAYYLLGSIVGAYYVVLYFLKKDIRKIGSGNVGATNAGRALGKKGFLLTLLVDVGKVVLPLSLITLLNGNDFYLVLASIFLIIGHLFPVQLRFQGGKGIVVFLSSALFLSPMTIAVMAIVLGFIYLIFQRYRVAGFISMATIPITSIVVNDSFITSIGLFLLFSVVVLSHQNWFQSSAT